MNWIKKLIGKPRNYGLTEEEKEDLARKELEERETREAHERAVKEKHEREERYVWIIWLINTSYTLR